MKNTTVSAASLIAGVKRDLQIAKDRLAAARNNKAQIAHDLKVAKIILGRSVSYMQAYLFGGKLHVSATISGLESLKTDKRLVRILERAIDVATPTGTSDYVATWIAERTFSFELPCGGELKIEARLKDGGSCHKVQTGVELVETPTYRIECA